MPGITFRNVTKLFDGSSASRAAVNNITLDVHEREFVVLLGPSGCGKTTLMRMVNRLIEPTSGEISVGDRDIHQISITDLRRQIGYVIQQGGLFPHMTVAQNIATVPRLLGWPKDRTAKRVDELLELVALSPDEYRGRYPRQLSGGQQQRIGIARAMAADPEVMLMDEPFGAIDAITRGDLQNELLKIQRKVGKTVMFVTHDVEEALRLADRIAVMRSGEVVQFDTPLNILSRPADAFVEELVGTQDVLRAMSLIPVTQVMQPLDGSANGLAIRDDEDVRAALSLLIANGAQVLTVQNTDGRPVGQVTLQAVMLQGRHEAEPVAP